MHFIKISQPLKTKEILGNLQIVTISLTIPLVARFIIQKVTDHEMTVYSEMTFSLVRLYEFVLMKYSFDFYCFFKSFV